MSPKSRKIKVVGMILTAFALLIFGLMITRKISFSTFWIGLIPLAVYAFFFLPKFAKTNKEKN